MLNVLMSKAVNIYNINAKRAKTGDKNHQYC